MTPPCIFDEKPSAHSCYDFSYEENRNFRILQWLKITKNLPTSSNVVIFFSSCVLQTMDLIRVAD